MKMGSETHGTESTISAAAIPGRGVRLVLNGAEYIPDPESFPWFRDASDAAVSNVRLERAGHLHWPDLDVDLRLCLIEHPELYPLISRG